MNESFVLGRKWKSTDPQHGESQPLIEEWKSPVIHLFPKVDFWIDARDGFGQPANEWRLEGLLALLGVLEWLIDAAIASLES